MLINAKPRVDAIRTPHWQGKPTSLLLSQEMLPDFARACRARDLPVVIMRQDAFAADYHLPAKKSAYTEGIERLLIKARLLIERHVHAVLGVFERWPLLRD